MNGRRDPTSAIPKSPEDPYLSPFVVVQFFKLALQTLHVCINRVVFSTFMSDAPLLEMPMVLLSITLLESALYLTSEHTLSLPIVIP